MICRNPCNVATGVIGCTGGSSPRHLPPTEPTGVIAAAMPSNHLAGRCAAPGRKSPPRRAPWNPARPKVRAVSSRVKSPSSWSSLRRLSPRLSPMTYSKRSRETRPAISVWLRRQTVRPRAWAVLRSALPGGIWPGPNQGSTSARGGVRVAGKTGDGTLEVLHGQDVAGGLKRYSTTS